MLLAWVLVLLLQSATFVTAQSCSGTLTISTSADTSKLSKCTTWDGNVIIGSSADGLIALDGLQQIYGNLTCINATQLTALSANELTSINGHLDMENLPILSTLSLPALFIVNNINFVGLPALADMTFTQGISNVNKVYISNTQLNSLTGIAPDSVSVMDVNNNPYLTSVNMSRLTNVTSSLKFAANGLDLHLEFPVLESVTNITMRNVSGVSLPSLSSITGSSGFYSDSLQDLSLPTLTTVGGSLAIADCSSLSTIDVPLLNQVNGDLNVQNNSRLELLSFPRLRTVVGAMILRGNFSSLSVPDLVDVRGGLQVQILGNYPCTNITALGQNGVVKGGATCTSGNSGTTTTGTSTGGTNVPTGMDSSTSHGLSGGAIGGIVAGVLVLVLIAGASTWYFSIRPKRKAKAVKSDDPPRGHELPLGGHHEKPELPAQPNHVSELKGDTQHTVHRDLSRDVLSSPQTNQTPSRRPVGSENSRFRNVHDLRSETPNPHELEGSNVPELHGR